ncbi:MAG TPA: universal stress protein [Burkholderiaceae bacterium]|nr:universal stress protein [Burkholderiaceae bacterium]
MYQRILVAVDGSPACAPALAEAIALAKEGRSEVLLAYVADTSGLFGGDGQFVDVYALEKAVVEHGRKVLAEAVAACAGAGIAAQARLLEMDQFSQRVADALVAEAKAWSADVIVMGTHGRGGARHLLIGSVAERAVRLARVPVLLVRSR